MESEYEIALNARIGRLEARELELRAAVQKLQRMERVAYYTVQNGGSAEQAILAAGIGSGHATLGD